jgi:dephospho-CoA kinase
MLLVALTGGIGSGKSLAGDYFAQLGAIVVDSDQLARSVVERGTEGFDEVISRFGDEILTHGDIDRRKLGEIIFSDEAARTDLEKIIHPRIREVWELIIESSGPSDILINQIPLLVETNGADRFDRVITVIASPEVRSARLKSRGLYESEIQRRIAAQASDEDRIEIADYIIENNGSADDLLREVEIVFEDLRKENIE